MRNLEIIGEAAKRISPEMRAQMADLPWKQIVGLRDVPELLRVIEGFLSVAAEI
jgi:uncharacterized protein with HEPN domain